MLVLTRKDGEQIMIGDDIIITVVQVRGRASGVRIGVDAPKSMEIRRAGGKEDEGNKAP